MIYSYKKEYDKYFLKYLEYAKENNYLLIWCDYECMKTYVYFDNKEMKFNYILTSNKFDS